jgi:hypothetical protein
MPAESMIATQLAKRIFPVFMAESPLGAIADKHASARWFLSFQGADPKEHGHGVVECNAKQ